MKKDSDRYFRHPSFPLVTFLYAKGEQIAGINPIEGDSSKKEFCFVRTKRLEMLVEIYKFGDKNDPELLVQVHIYEQARRELLDRLNGR